MCAESRLQCDENLKINNLLIKQKKISNEDEKINCQNAFKNIHQFIECFLQPRTIHNRLNEAPAWLLKVVIMIWRRKKKECASVNIWLANREWNYRSVKEVGGMRIQSANEFLKRPRKKKMKKTQQPRSR